jgi:SAM-dependent methyltransferase
MNELYPRISERYRGSGRFARGYVAGKLRRDPVYAALLALGPLGAVLDLGCGRGQLGVLLLEAGLADAVHGMDWSAAHLQQGLAATDGLAYTAERRDLTAPGVLPAADTVLMIDVLYQLDTAAQRALLMAAVASARRRILIRTADPGRGLRSAFHRGIERMARPFWPHSGARVNAQAPAVIAECLRQAGFTVTAAPCWQGTPFANVLLRAERTAP